MNTLSLTRIRFLALICLVLFTSAAQAQQQERQILSRIFFQDDQAKTIRWADLYQGSPPTLGEVKDVDGFPTIDPESQSLVQMEAVDGMLFVGVRDDKDGAHQSGWVLIDSGVEAEPHDGHIDYHYSSKPKVRAACLDEKQGNPAHLYVYDQVFYLANDKREGYTRLDPSRVRPSDDADAIIAQAQFLPGGGGHITLAAVGNQVGYSTWIDREGDNCGRVDVTNFANRKIAYSLKLPHGGLHGATASSGKVFFAPTDGICWVQADVAASSNPEQVKINHISLGKHLDTEKPIRTGAFATLGKHVLFVTGDGPTAALQMLDAASDEPVPHKLNLDLDDGARPTGPAVGMAIGNFPMAVVFHEHAAGSETQNKVSLVELDPNADGDFTDAKVGKVLDVGRSKVSGHAGHHAATFLPDQRHVVFSNPGDGTLGVLRVRRLEAVAELKVGGVPSKIEAIGGPSGH